MKIVAALLAVLVSAAVAYAQSPVTVIGPVTPGNCTEFFSVTQIKAVTGGGCITPTDLGTMAYENSNNVSITGGTIASVTITSSAINGGTITNLPDPTAAQDAATKAYVDSVAVGLNIHPAVNLATAAALPSNTYSNGTAGVGATLTATSNAALTVDGVAVSTANRILVKDESAQENNGAYVVTQAGDGSNPYILTRSTDADTPSEMSGGDAFLVLAGSTNISTTWVSTAPVVTFGTTPITFAQFSAAITTLDSSKVTFQEGGAGALNGSVQTRLRSDINISDFAAGGTSNDTTGVQAAFTACSNSGAGCSMSCSKGVTYTIDKITISSSVNFDGAGCFFVQRTAAPTSDYAVFDVNTASNVILRNIHMVGTVVGAGTSVGASGNSSIRIKSSDHVWVQNSTLNNSLYFAVEIKSSSYVWVDGNSAHLDAFGFFVSSSDHVSITNNKLDQTALYSLTPTTNQFATAINLDSTDGGNSVSTNIVIANNNITRYPYAQGILAHAGQYVTITGNVINGSMAGISLNAFNSTDTLSDFTITGNVIIGNGGTTTLPGGSEDVGIFVGGTPVTTPVAAHITVSNNTVDAANRVEMSSSLGCYVFGYNIDLTVTGNQGRGCGGNGMIFINEEDGAAVSGNSISNIVDTGGGHYYGYWWQIAPRATMMSNMAQNVNYGYVVSGVDTNLKWKDSGGGLLNGCYAVATSCNSP